ncbi:MAG: V-type ATP synthase subunit E family protein [Infirmifilum sp.]
MGSNESLMEAILKELRSAAEEEYQRIIKEAEEQAKKLLEDAYSKAESLRKQRITQLLDETRRKIESELAPQRLEIRRKFLAERYNYILTRLEEILSHVAREVVENKEYHRAFLARGIDEAISSIKSSKVNLHPCRESKKLLQEVINAKKDALAKAKPGLELNVGEDVECAGGFLAVSNDNKEYYNATLEAKISEIRERVLPELLNKILNERVS